MCLRLQRRRTARQGSDIHWVASQNPQKARELLHLPQCILSLLVSHGSLKIDVEQVLEILRLTTTDSAQGLLPLRAALDLGEVDVAEGEGREHLEEGARGFLRSKDDAGLEGLVESGDDWLAGKHDEAGDIGAVILNAICQDVHAIDLCCAGAGNGGSIAKTVLCNEFGGAGRVVHGLT
ncbi:hypothetical protein L7F22_023679 [Adiantum nelumboides]|nr:hypothetical protein [Adiantum nelumboides]